MGWLVGGLPLVALAVFLFIVHPQVINNPVYIVGWVIIAVISLVAAWAWSSKLKHRLKTSLQILENGATQLNSGSYDHLFPPFYSDAHFAEVFAHFDEVATSFQRSSQEQAQSLEEVRQLYSRVDEQARHLKTLNEIIQAINSTLDIETLYQVVVERLRQQVKFDWLAIAVIASEGDEPRLVKVEPAGLITAYQQGLSVRADTLTFKAFDQRKTIYKPYLWRGQERDLEADKAFAEVDLRSLVLLPIYYNNQKLGVLSLASYQPDAFSREQIELLEVTAVQLSTAISNARGYSQLRDAYRDLEQAQVAVKQAARQSALGEMAAGVAHDFNNILTAILGNGELLSMVLEQPEELEFAKGIVKAANDAAKMIRRISDFGRRRTYVEFSQLNLNEIVKDALDFARPRLKAEAEMRGALIKVETDLNATEFVYGNAFELREALTNLIGNAIDAMPTGGILQLNTFNAENQVGLSICDTGQGMSPETLNHIFEAFYSTKGEGGTGLGLAVTNGIISRHHGQLDVKSALNEGTTFTITLPLAKFSVNLFTEAELESVLIAETSSVEVKVGAKVLVADDDPGARMALGRSLRKAGYVVTEAQNGLEAWELMQEHNFDLLIADMGMPVLNAIDLVQQVRQAGQKLPVILVTGWNYSPNQSRLNSLQIETVIAKPYHYQELIDLISRAIKPPALGVA